VAGGSSSLWSSAPIGPVGPAIGGEDAFSGDEARRRSVANLGRIASGEAHDLGNWLIGIVFCLKRLRGCQRSEELEEIIEQALHAADQGLDTMRALLQATRVVLHLASREPGRRAIAPAQYSG
jgi:hypothetical protein